MHSFIHNIFIMSDTVLRDWKHWWTDWNPPPHGIGNLWELLILESRIISLFSKYLVWHCAGCSFTSQHVLNAYYVPTMKDPTWMPWSLLMRSHSPLALTCYSYSGSPYRARRATGDGDKTKGRRQERLIRGDVATAESWRMSSWSSDK